MTTFYVSKAGKDSNSGTSPSNAFATLDRAVAAMGAKSSGDVTYVMDGTYNLRSAVDLTAKNSNDTISAYQDDTPVIRGGTNVTNWTSGPNGVWTAKLPNVSAVEQFTVNDRRQIEARHPNFIASDPIKGGWLWAKDVPSGHDASWEMAYNKSDISSSQLKAGEKVTVFAKLGYASNVLEIKSVDTSAGIIKFAQQANYDIGSGSRFFISGDKGLLDRPGEWSFDKSSHVLSYKAPASFDGTKAVASGTTSLLSISNASNVTIKGLTFSDTGTDSHSASIDTAAIKVEESNNITIQGNRFLNVASGVSIEDNSNKINVLGNNFQHIWSSAVDVYASAYSNSINNNRIIESGEVFRTNGAIQMTESWGNTISGNLIKNVPRFGIAESNYSSGNKSGGNIIQYNTILHSGQETPDVGAIYAYSHDDKGALGDIIRYNRIIDAGGLGTNSSGFINGRYMSAGIYLDDNTSNAKIYGNFVQGAWFGGVYLHGGNGNDVWGNILVGNTEFGVQLFAIDGQSMGTNKIHGNIVTLPTHSGQPVVSLDPHYITTSNFFDNIYVGSSQAMVGQNALPKWQQMGGDRGSTVVPNPGFENASDGDYSLKPGSYAINRGFTDLPWGKMAPAPGISADGGLPSSAVKGHSPKADAPPQNQSANDRLIHNSSQEKFSFDKMLDTQSHLDDPTESGTIGDGAYREKLSDLGRDDFSFHHFSFAGLHGTDHVVHDNDDMDIAGAIAIATTSHSDFHVI